MGASVAWKAFDTGTPASPIVSNGRFRLASPTSVLGSPSLAMQSAAQLAVVNVYSDDSGRIEAVLTVAGTTLTPIVNSAGKPFTAQQLFGLSIEVTGITNGEVLYTTDEPNGSPSAPFTTTAERTAWAAANLATLRSGVSRVWGPGDSTEYVWNGPLATDWAGIRGPYPGSPGSPFASPEEFPAVGSPGQRIAVSNALSPEGLTWFLWDVASSAYRICPEQVLADFSNADGSPILDLTATALTPGVTTEVWASPTALPDWLFATGRQLTVLAEVNQKDSASTAASSIFVVIKSSPYTGSDIYSVIFGYSAAISAAWRGVAATSNRVRVMGANLVGKEGTAQGTGGEGNKVVGEWDAGLTKPRISFRPGATTNQIIAHRITILSGER